MLKTSKSSICLLESIGVPSSSTEVEGEWDVLDDAVTKKFTIEVNARIKLAYKEIQKSTGVLGGNGTWHIGIDSNSRFIDVGGELGRPNFH